METPLPDSNNIITHRQAREYGHDLLRRNIIEASSRLLIQEGPDALTVRRVAQELDCSTKIIYTMFKGKDGLANALYVEGCKRLRAYLEQVQPVPEPTKYLYELALAYWNFAFANPGYYTVMFGGAIPNFTPSETSIQSTEDAFEIVIRSVRYFMDEGKLAADDPVMVAKFLWAPLHGIVSLQLMGHFQSLDMARSIFERTVQVIIASLRSDV